MEYEIRYGDRLIRGGFKTVKEAKDAFRIGIPDGDNAVYVCAGLYQVNGERIGTLERKVVVKLDRR